MGYNLINWENSPSKQTPINAENLNQMDVNIAKAIQGTRFNFSATFTSDGVLKNTTSTEALGPGGFATSQTDIVTVFVADNVTKINNGAFSNCTSLKTIYIDNTVGNVDIVSGAVPSGVSIVYSNDENYLNVNELLASAIRSLKSSVNTNRTDWENRATSIETQHKTDVTELSQTIQKVKESALEEFASVKADVSTNEKSIESLKADFNKSVDEINTTLDTKENVSNKVSVITHPSLDYYPDTKAVFDYVNSKLETPLSDIESLKADKLDKTDFNSYKTSNDNAVNSKVDTTEFNTYKTATDKAVADNADKINLLDTNKADLVQSQNLYDWSKLLTVKSNIFTINKTEDEGYHITGTTVSMYQQILTNQKLQLDDGDYYISDSAINNTDIRVYCQLSLIDTDGKSTYYSNAKVTIDNSKYTSIYLTVQTGATVGEVDNVIYPMLCKYEDVNIPYLPHMVSEGIPLIAECIPGIKSYIDNKFNELATALVAHESEVM